VLNDSRRRSVLLRANVMWSGTVPLVLNYLSAMSTKHSDSCWQTSREIGVRGRRVAIAVSFRAVGSSDWKAWIGVRLNRL